MDVLRNQDLPALFEAVGGVFTEKADELCEMDAKLGDGDLGLTMRKGYNAMPEILRAIEEADLGKRLMMAGMKLASAVPSTMGTLMASGIMEGGKACKGRTELDGAGLSVYLTGFAAGIQKRGKCARGDRTILDAVGAAADCAAETVSVNPSASLRDVIAAALHGADEGVEATKAMTPKFGKAAVHAAAAVGVADQGAWAGRYMILGMYRCLCGDPTAK